MAAIGACAGFASISGSSMATAATMGQVALPELRRNGYSGALATGTLAAGGTLGILIPPSLVLVVYATLTEQNIAKLFICAFVPGFLAALGYMIAIRVYVWFNPDEAGLRERVPYAARLQGPAVHLGRSADLRAGAGRHLWRLLHADRGGRDRCVRHVPYRPAQGRTDARSADAGRVPDRNAVGDALLHPAWRRRLQHLSGADAAAAGDGGLRRRSSASAPG